MGLRNMGYEITLNDLVDGNVQDTLVKQLMEAGFTERQASDLLLGAKEMGMSPEENLAFQDFFKNDDGSINYQKTLAYARVNSRIMTLDSYIPVLNDRINNDAAYEDNEDGTPNSKNLKDLDIAVQMMKKAGYSAREMAHVVNNLIKIATAYTWHPTELLSENGRKLARNLVKAAESGDLQVLKDAVNDIIHSDDFEATRRDHILNEIDDNNEVSRLHNKAVNELDRAVERMIYNATGEYVEIHSNTAPRSWAYDADGKNNAEGFSMMAKMATTKMGALMDLVNNLEVAKAKDIPADLKDRMESMQNDVQKIVNRLQPIYDRSREITLELAQRAPEEREAFYQKNYSQYFKPLLNDFGNIYDEVDGGRDAEAFYHDLIGDGESRIGILDKWRLELEEHDTGAAFAIDESYRTLLRCGFALERGQTRHNDLVNKNILDNLFASDAFWSLGILGDTDREAISMAGKFSDLTVEEQACYFDKIIVAIKSNDRLRDDLLETLGVTNILTFKKLEDGGNGYPEQEHTYNDRMDLRALFPMMFAEGVISDASDKAPAFQKFLADIRQMEHMRHMSLHEDDMTLGCQGINMTTYNKYGGADNRKSREDSLRVFYRRWVECLHVMRAASDAEKTLGSFTRLQAMQQFREVVREGYKMGVPIEFMIGGGGSLNRFGGDVGMVRRIVAQELKDIIEDKKANGGEYDIKDEKMLLMASSILYTEQGRTKRYISATQNQIRDNFAGKMVQIIQDVMDIRGNVPSYTFIDKRHRFTPEMKAVQNNAHHQARLYYKALTHAVKIDSNGNKEYVMDSYFGKVGCPHLDPYMNNGSRPAAGKAKGKAKGVSSGRAIGKDKSSYLGQTFHCGIYGSGFVMRRFYDRLHANKGANGSFNEKKISLRDISELMNQPDWDEAVFSRNLVDAGRFNASHLFRRVSDKEWTFDRAVEVGRSVQIINEGKAKGGDDMWVIKAANYEDYYSHEELYLAKIYYDRVAFLAMTEAALTPQGQGITMQSDQETIIRSFRPKDNGLDFGLGERTKAFQPDVVETIKNHEMNASAYSFMYMINDDIEYKIQNGMTKKEAIATYGGFDVDADYGDDRSKVIDEAFKHGESYLRVVCASFCAGTMPHKHKWMSKNTYGVENRSRYSMEEFLDILPFNGNPYVDYEAAGLSI